MDSIMYLILVLANILLVGVTLYYAIQTRVMVKQHEKSEKEKVKPLFIPGAEVLIRGEDLWHFIYINEGESAFFVKTMMKKSNTVDTCFKQIVRRSEKISCGTFKRHEKFTTILQICFHDRLARIYLQTIPYDSESGYRFDDSGLPIEIKEEPPWAKTIMHFIERKAIIIDQNKAD